MARMKEKARKSTGNGGQKRKQAIAKQARLPPRKKLKTQAPADPEDNSIPNQSPEEEESDEESLTEEASKKPQASRGGRPEEKDAKTNTTSPTQENFDKSIATRDPALLSDLFAQNIRKYSDNLTSLEQGDLNVPSSAFRDTTSFESPHTEDNLAAFLETYATGGKKALSTCEATASPHTAIVVTSGMRVADIYRRMLVFNNKDCKVGKIIAKHMRLLETVKYLEETKVGIVITTPQRLADLIAKEAISPETLQRIVIDGSYRNEKNQTMFDMEELFKSLMGLMGMEKVKPRLGLGRGRIELMMF